MRLYYLYLLVMSHTWRGAGGYIFISIYVVFVLENLVIIAALCRVTWPGNYTIIEPSAACHNQHAAHRDTSIINNSNVGILGFISQLGFNQTGLKSFNWRVKFYNSAGNEIIYRV